jgi:WD40 repeat protein
MLQPFPGGQAARLVALALVGAGLVLALAAPAADEKPSIEEARAAQALERLTGMEKSLAGNPVKLRHLLNSLRLAHPGTQAAVKASAWLARLPSPLDRLDRTTIPPLEKFDWQPKELVGVLGEHRGRHGAAVASVAFSSDGSLIASGGGQYVRVWAPATMRLAGMGGTSHSTTSVAFTKDSKTLVAGTGYGYVYVWDLPKGKGMVYRFHVAAATSPVYGVACHPGNKLVAAACHDNLVRVYDITGKAMKEVGQVTGHRNAVRCLAFSPDGKTLATGSDDQTVRLWDMTTPDYKERSLIEGLGASVLSLAFTASGTTLATGSSDGTVRLWNMPASPRPKAPRLLFQGPKSAVGSLCFSKSGQTLAATHSDSSVRLWGLGGKVRERFRLDGHKGAVTSTVYSPDMKLLVSGSDDWTCRTWDLTKPKQPVERFEPWSHLSHVYAAAFATDSMSIATGSHDSIVRFWDLNRPDPRTRNYLKFDVPVYGVAYSPDGRWVAAAGQTTTIRQWDAGKARSRLTFKNQPGYTHLISYSPDSKYLLAMCGKEVILYDVVRGGEVKRFTGHQTNLLCAGFSPDGRLVYSGSGYYEFDKMGKYVLKNGKHVWTDCILKLWDVDKSEELLALKQADTPFYAANFSADGRMLLAANYDQNLRRWHFTANKPVETTPWKGSSGHAHGIWPTPDGKYLLTRGLDYQLILWDMATGKRLKQWTFQEQMGGVAVGADSRHIAVGLGTGVVYMLRLSPASGSEGGAPPGKP